MLFLCLGGLIFCSTSLNFDVYSSSYLGAPLLELVHLILHNLYMTMMIIEMLFCQGPTLLTGKKMSGTKKLFQRLLVKSRKGRSLANFILTEEDTRMELFNLYDLLIYKTSIDVFMNAIRL